jgi:hypothetical protein
MKRGVPVKTGKRERRYKDNKMMIPMIDVMADFWKWFHEH